MYKTELIGYTPVANKIAKKIEDRCNEMEKDGFALVSATTTPGAKAILIFKKWYKHKLMNYSYIKGEIWKLNTKF